MIQDPHIVSISGNIESRSGKSVIRIRVVDKGA